jgi:hypothetical protein
MVANRGFWSLIAISATAHAVSQGKALEEVLSQEISSNGELGHVPLMRREHPRSEEQAKDAGLVPRFLGEFMRTFSSSSKEVQQETLRELLQDNAVPGKVNPHFAGALIDSEANTGGEVEPHDSGSLVDLETSDQLDDADSEFVAQAPGVLYNSTNFNLVTTQGNASKSDDDVRSGNPGEINEATWTSNVSLSIGSALELRYQYVVGFACNATFADGPPTFDVLLGEIKIGNTQGPFSDFPADACANGCQTCYSGVRTMTFLANSTFSGTLKTRFINNKRNMNLKILDIRMFDPSKEEARIRWRLRNRDRALRARVKVISKASRAMKRAARRARRAVKQLEETASSYKAAQDMRNAEDAKWMAAQKKSEQDIAAQQEAIQRELLKTVSQVRNVTQALASSSSSAENQSLLNATVNLTTSVLNSTSAALNETVKEATIDLKVLEKTAMAVLKVEKELVILANNLTNANITASVNITENTTPAPTRASSAISAAIARVFDLGSPTVNTADTSSNSSNSSNSSGSSKVADANTEKKTFCWWHCRHCHRLSCCCDYSCRYCRLLLEPTALCSKSSSSRTTCRKC